MRTATHSQIMLITVFLMQSLTALAHSSVHNKKIEANPQETKKMIKAEHITSEAEAGELAEAYLNQANQVGKSHYYNLAEIIIDPWLNDNTKAATWLLKAKIEQHRHRFDAAIETLNTVLANNKPFNKILANNAHLMAARIHLVKRNTQSAKSHCQQLVNDAQVNLAAICLLEVASYDGQLESSYNLLKKMSKNINQTSSYRPWMNLMLSDMAARMNDIEEEVLWLEQAPFDSDISHLTAWAKNKLKHNQPGTVLQKLGQLHQENHALEDALLLQLALAEKQQNHLLNTHNNKWKKLIKSRIELREQQGLILHANEVAHYYLSLANNPTKAHHWALINWQQSQEHNDKLLLDATQKAYELAQSIVN